MESGNMTARDVLELIRKRGASVAAEDGKLKLRAPEPLPAELMDLAREYKPDLLALLQNREGGDSWEWIDERAAILEYDAGLSRDQAQAKAFEMWFERFVGGTLKWRPR